MKRLFLWIILLVAVAAGIGWLAMQSPGYVLITYDQYRYESTLWIFVGVLFALWLVWLLLRRGLHLLAVSASLLNPWSRHYRDRRVARAAQAGQRELAEGGWRNALTHLQVAAEYSERPLVHYLGAAQAADNIGEYKQRDQLLDKALSRDPDAALAIGLTRARMQVEHTDYSAAQVTLDDLRTHFSRHPQVLDLQQKLYVCQGDWRALCELLPELRRHKVLASDALLGLERQAWSAELQRIAYGPMVEGAEPLERLQGRWQEVPMALRTDPVVVRAYAASLSALGATHEALEMIVNVLKSGFDASLVALFGRIPGSDPAGQLQTAEDWLGRYPENPDLFLALARLSQRNELWDKARGYFESALGCARRPDICNEFASLLAQQGDTERSSQLFQEALQLSERAVPVIRG